MQWKWVQNYCFEQIAWEIGGSVCIYMIGIIIIIIFILCLYWVVFPFRIKDLEDIVCFFFCLIWAYFFITFIVFILIIRKHSTIHGLFHKSKEWKMGWRIRSCYIHNTLGKIFFALHRSFGNLFPSSLVCLSPFSSFLLLCSSFIHQKSRYIIWLDPH